MKLGLMQPYFFPYIGYWQLISAVDKFVVYDDVTYIKGGWINRNNFLINNEKKLYSISLDKASSNKLINSIYIKDDFSKFLKMLQTNYSKAPFFKDIFSLIKEMVLSRDQNLATFLYTSIVLISQYLSIDTEILLSSNLHKDNDLQGQEKVLHICDVLNADIYINSIGGVSLYQKETFLKKNKNLLFLKTEAITYQQYSNNHISNLSIIDVLMFNSVEDVRKLLNQYELR